MKKYNIEVWYRYSKSDEKDFFRTIVIAENEDEACKKAFGLRQCVFKATIIN